MSLSDYIKEHLSLEEYSFSRDELVASSSKNITALQNELSHAVAKGDITPLRKGFYLIIPPRYSKQGKLPIRLYSEKLFKSLDRPYYIACILRLNFTVQAISKFSAIISLLQNLLYWILQKALLICVFSQRHIGLIKISLLKNQMPEALKSPMPY